jgi:hypothetical protein
VPDHFDHCSLSGAVEPTTGARFFLALPYLNSRAFQVWFDGCATALPASVHVLLLDNGAGHNAQVVR